MIFHCFLFFIFIFFYKNKFSNSQHHCKYLKQEKKNKTNYNKYKCFIKTLNHKIKQKYSTQFLQFSLTTIKGKNMHIYIQQHLYLHTYHYKYKTEVKKKRKSYIYTIYKNKKNILNLFLSGKPTPTFLALI